MFEFGNTFYRASAKNLLPRMSFSSIYAYGSFHAKIFFCFLKTIKLLLPSTCISVLHIHAQTHTHRVGNNSRRKFSFGIFKYFTFVYKYLCDCRLFETLFKRVLFLKKTAPQATATATKQHHSIGYWVESNRAAEPAFANNNIIISIFKRFIFIAARFSWLV